MRLTTRLFIPLLGLHVAAFAQSAAPAAAPKSSAKPAPATVATAAPGDSLTGPASDRYRRGAIGRFFFGTHYRPTWEMPVTVPTFRPDKLFGGLRAVKEGGSMQTLNLRMVAPDGHQYVLRSVDKDLTRALPEKKRAGMQAQTLQDQTSAVNPYGALVAASLAEAAGVYHASPKLYRVPTTENVLGEFQDAFAGRLVYLEERPDGDWRTRKEFGLAPRVVSSEEMLRARYAAPGTDFNAPLADVDAHAYLRARLLDIYLGDWSRREDQWRWALVSEENGTPRYRPIPRDRDHAFSRYADGVFPALAVLFKREVVSFGPKIEKVSRYVESSETLDRVLLGWLDEGAFTAEATSLQAALTDASIDKALTQWPANVQRLDGRKFRQALQQRRDQLPGKAKELYRYLAKQAVLVGTDGEDRYRFESEGQKLKITWQARLDTAGRHGMSTYGRSFNPTETKSICLYQLAGRDQIELVGPLPAKGPKIEIFDGPGRDEARRSGPVETPKWFRLRASGDENRLDALPEWARKPVKKLLARDFDANGFLLRHRF
jgi:hypothetical protein